MTPAEAKTLLPPLLDFVKTLEGDDLALAPKSEGWMKFAELLWPGRFLIEMKSRGEKLEKLYEQLFYYWSHIIPKHPPSAIQHYFNELWVRDF